MSEQLFGKTKRKPGPRKPLVKPLVPTSVGVVETVTNSAGIALGESVPDPAPSTAETDVQPEDESLDLSDSSVASGSYRRYELVDDEALYVTPCPSHRNATIINYEQVAGCSYQKKTDSPLEDISISTGRDKAPKKRSALPPLAEDPNATYTCYLSGHSHINYRELKSSNSKKKSTKQFK